MTNRTVDHPVARVPGLLPFPDMWKWARKAPATWLPGLPGVAGCLLGLIECTVLE